MAKAPGASMEVPLNMACVGVVFGAVQDGWTGGLHVQKEAAANIQQPRFAVSTDLLRRLWQKATNI